LLDRVLLRSYQRPLAFNDFCDPAKRSQRRAGWAHVSPAIFLEFHALEITARNDSFDISVLGHRNMPEATLAHRAQRINCTAFGRNRNGIARHRFRQLGAASILGFGQQSHGIATREDAAQVLSPVDDEHRSAPTFPHASACLPNALVSSEHQRLLVFDNVG
jgi:hypothetical protein